HGSPVKVATNSSDRPGPYRAIVPVRAPSTLSSPLATCAVPPLSQAPLDQPGGSDVSEKSRLKIGTIISSQSTVRGPLSTLKSLTRGRRCAPTGIAWVATTAPSIEKTTIGGYQSIR